MTVLFAFVSPKHNSAFIAADNLNAVDGTRVDKIEAAFDRFAVGFYGIDAIHDAFKFIGYFHDRIPPTGNHCTIDSIEKILDGVASVLPRIVLKHRQDWPRHIAAKRATTAQYELWASQGGGMAIVDYRDMLIFDAELDELPTTATTCKFTVTKLVEERVHRFGINGVQDVLQVGGFARTPRGWAEGQIMAARAEVESHGRFGAIGIIGASFHKLDAKTEHWSAYESPDDFLTSLAYPRFRGKSSSHG